MTTIRMRDPCKRCGAIDGRIDQRNGQDCVFCNGCGAWCYNAPRVETGRAVRSVTTVHAAIKPKHRARILRRDGMACVICHATDKPLHVGHLLSVDTGIDLGLTDRELNADDNLAAMCEECNLGLGREPLPLRLCAAILKAAIRGLARSDEPTEEAAE